LPRRTINTELDQQLRQQAEAWHSERSSEISATGITQAMYDTVPVETCDKRADLGRTYTTDGGSKGELRGNSEELWGNSGKLRETQEELREAGGAQGKLRGALGKLGGK
jgi:hypothetical protein